MYPKAFEAYRQFILHRNKMPINPHTLQPFAKGSNWQLDPTCWTDCYTATAMLQVCGPEYGLGFLFTRDDPFWFVDIDKCLVDGKWSTLSQDVLAMFPGCYVEVSQSGTGLHIFGSGKPSSDHACKAIEHGLEFYTEHRFVALTGMHAAGDAATLVSPDRFIERFMARAVVEQSLGWTTEPVEEYHHLNDEELIKRALRSGGAGSIFGERATFADLWNCNERVLCRAFPHSEQPFDRSSADAALAQHLMFWTGRNCERTRELMRQSELRRDKYDREDYLIRTIERACNLQKDVYRGPDRRREEQIEENRVIGETFEDSIYSPTLTLEDMLRDMVFIGGEHAVGYLPTKTLRRKAAAADEYAASYHTYVDPDTRAEKRTPAFKAWLARPTRKSVECATWAPGKPDLCSPPEGHGLAFNTWRGLKGHNVPDDWNLRVQPWVDHVMWLSGDEGPRFMQWLAHIVQRPAELPHTCYLHVTPTTGIGRNWVAGVLCRVLRGYVASGVDLGKILDGAFNGRLSQKLLAVVDEVREGGDLGRKHARGEKLKATITEEIRHIDPKFGVQTVEYNCCRWLMFSQHLDALPFENNDRRVVVVENPTKRKAPEYYARLYELWHDREFIGSVWQYLMTLGLEDYSPSLPAALTQSKQNALYAMSSELDFAVSDLVKEWPGNFITFSQLQRIVGPASDGHLRHVIMRQGLTALPTRVKLPDGTRSRVVVIRGGREVPGCKELTDLCMEAAVKYELDR